MHLILRKKTMMENSAHLRHAPSLIFSISCMYFFVHFSVLAIQFRGHDPSLENPICVVYNYSI